MSWKKLKTKLLLDHPRLKVYEDNVMLPSGHKTKYIYFGETSDSAAIIAKNNEGKILVQKEYNYPTNERLYQFPGGGVSEGESFETAAKRELAEEAKLSGKLQDLGWYYVDNRRKKINNMYTWQLIWLQLIQRMIWRRNSKISATPKKRLMSLSNQEKFTTIHFFVPGLFLKLSDRKIISSVFKPQA